jgi:hypothetical protein
MTVVHDPSPSVRPCTKATKCPRDVGEVPIPSGPQTGPHRDEGARAPRGAHRFDPESPRRREIAISGSAAGAKARETRPDAERRSVPSRTTTPPPLARRSSDRAAPKQGGGGRGWGALPVRDHIVLTRRPGLCFVAEMRSQGSGHGRKPANQEQNATGRPRQPTMLP